MRLNSFWPRGSCLPFCVAVLSLLPPKQGVSQESVTGRILDLKGNPVAEAQVALCAKMRGVSIRGGKLGPTNAGRESLITKTGVDGRFTLPKASEEFHIVAASEAGFACPEGKSLEFSADIPLMLWGRVEGTLRIGQRLGADSTVRLLNYSNANALYGFLQYSDEALTDAEGRFVFEKVPCGWIAVGHSVPMGKFGGVYTNDMFIHVQPGQTVETFVGGEGRPVTGRFVPADGYTAPGSFQIGLYTMSTARPERPRPDHYDQMTIRERQQWYDYWRQTPEAQAYDDQVRHDPNKRLYAFGIEQSGFFRIDDVIPGKYRTIIQEPIAGPEQQRQTGLYYGTIEVPGLPQLYTDEPLDLGNLVLRPCREFEIGDTAPPFAVVTLDGKMIRLADYRSQFVLLNFWHPTYDPEIANLKDLYAVYGTSGKLQFIGFAGFGTLREVEDHIGEHGIEWPQVYCGESWEAPGIEQYSPPSPSYSLLVDPEGKIAAEGSTVSRQVIENALKKTEESTIR
jgi:hypothetical protein